MSKIPIIIDTDPGIDDTTAILMCLAAKELEVKAITTVSGNVDVVKTSINACKIVELSGKEIKVAVGAKRPLVREAVTAEHVHGVSGMGMIQLEEPMMKYEDEDAVEMIYNQAMAANGTLKILVLGPFTNIAVALLKYPELKESIKSIVFMGGAMRSGNIAPSSEFNIYVDPEAAKIVFESGIHMVMVGLNITHETIVTKEQNKVIHAMNNQVSKVVATLIDYTIEKENPFNKQGAVMHDPLAAAAMIDSTIIKTKYYHVDVELKGDLTRGETVVDVYGVTKKKPNIHVGVKADNQKFLKLLYRTIGLY